MTPKTKEFIEEVKKRDSYQSFRLITIDDYHAAHADRRELLKVIESQEKEIERLKVIAEYVTANVYFKDSTWGAICVSCLSERGKGHDEDCELYTAIKHLLEAL